MLVRLEVNAGLYEEGRHKAGDRKRTVNKSGTAD
jgi:hypothetical protein